ncbi:hypothetical protein E3N88_11247 [Mikania micrantha]|uniref:14-3-3 domain-containing protein n=1 Tax=Mikania micrantha TaxID=192012 RepID=A0A5N6PFS1_9ASTR|nr:hypothetical protein E3N88_11247 [Mikania micrantha]
MDEGLERENHAPISKFKSAPLKWHLKVAPVKKLSSKSLKRSLDLHSSAHSQLLLLIPTAGGYARPASSSGGRSQVVNAGQVGTTSWLWISCYELIQILIFLLSVVTTYCYFIHPNFAGTSLSELGTKLIDLAIDMRLKMNRSRNLVNVALIKAYHLPKEAFDDVISELASLRDKSYKDSTLITRLLKNNLSLWTLDILKDGSKDGRETQIALCCLHIDDYLKNHQAIVKSWRKLKALVRYNKIGTRSGFSRFKPCYIITRILGIAKNTIQGVVFNEVLTAAARDIVTKDILRMASAHTKESAKALADMIQITYPHARLAFVVAMANDKDPQAFAIELHAGRIL